MKRKLSALFCLIISLMMVTTCALAEDWFCPECGHGNTGNFCYYCGAKRPVVESSGEAISNIRFKLEDNGDIVVTWDDSSNSPPYTVSYKAQNDSGMQDPVNSKNIALEFLIPGETYTVTVSNENGKASTEYIVPVNVFTEFTKKKIVLKETNFSISAVENDRTKQFQLQWHYPQLRKNRIYKGKLVTMTPRGYGGYVRVYYDFEMESKYSYIYDNYSMQEFFEGIKGDFDEIPTGRYSFEMYFDGKLYAECSFNVTR